MRTKRADTPLTSGFEERTRRSSSDRLALPRSPGVAIVLWSGRVGGAEVFMVELAKQLRQLNMTTEIVFIGDPEPLVGKAEAAGLPCRALGFRRGAEVLRRPRQLAAAITEAGSDGALLVTPGYLAASLRAGGYQGTIVAIDHGTVLHRGELSMPWKVWRSIDRASGAWATDAEVAVSQFLYRACNGRSHTRVVHINNGIDLSVFAPRRVEHDSDADYSIGFGGRLVPGKGVDDLLAAAAELVREGQGRIRIAGEGPDLPRLRELARSLEIEQAVELLGAVSDMPTFWNACDVAVVPSRLVESFGMVAIEAMACGVPVVVTRTGALPEVVGDAGVVVEPGDVSALGEALARFRSDRALRRKHGFAGRARCEELFDIATTAARYADLLVPSNRTSSS